MASLLLGDPVADLTEPWVAVQAVLMGQETKRSPGPALLTDEGQPFAMRIIFSKREEGKLLAVNLKNASRPCQLTWMVSQNGVILVTGPDPVLHVGDTLPPKPPAFVTYLEAGERHSSKKHRKAPQLRRDSPAQQGRSSGSRHHSWTCPGDSPPIPCSVSPPSAPAFLYLSNPLILQLMQKAVGLSHHVPFPSPWRHGATPWMSRHPPCSQLLTLKMVALLTLRVVALLTLRVVALLTSKLSSAFTIQQSVLVARSRKRVERRARPNAVNCKAALMGLPARAQRRPPPLLWPLPRYLIHQGQSATEARVSSGFPRSHLGPIMVLSAAKML